MSKDKARRFDGISRPSTDLYKKNYDSIFGKKKTNKMLEKYKEQLKDVKQYQENLTESEENEQ